MCFVYSQTAISCFISRVIRLNFVFLQNYKNFAKKLYNPDTITNPFNTQ